MTTASEIIETLTGYDELAIEKATGRTVEELASTGRELHLTRALAAIQISREKDVKYADAYKEAMSATQRELAAMFEDEPEDAMPEAPDSEAGKDSSPSPATRRTSRRSA